MRRLLRRARKHWNIPIDLEQFQWGGRDGIKRDEPDERTRELTSDEEARFWAHIDEGYEDLCELYIISGKRELIWTDLTKQQVDLSQHSVKIRVLKKRRNRIVDAKLTPREFEIIATAYALSPANNAYVFTARSYRKRDGGLRRRISPRMLYSHVKKACDAAGIPDFHPHDFRHTFASRALRKDPNLKKLQEALDHSSIKSTARYAHVLEEDVVKMRSWVTVSRPASGARVRKTGTAE